MIERHDELEATRGDAPILVGARPSLADGVLIGVARRLDVHEAADPARWPRLRAPRPRIEADPAMACAAAVETGERPADAGACVGPVALEEVITRWGS